MCVQSIGNKLPAVLPNGACWCMLGRQFGTWCLNGPCHTPTSAKFQKPNYQTQNVCICQIDLYHTGCWLLSVIDTCPSMGSVEAIILQPYRCKPSSFLATISLTLLGLTTDRAAHGNDRSLVHPASSLTTKTYPLSSPSSLVLVRPHGFRAMTLTI